VGWQWIRAIPVRDHVPALQSHGIVPAASRRSSAKEKFKKHTNEPVILLKTNKRALWSRRLSRQVIENIEFSSVYPVNLLKIKALYHPDELSVAWSSIEALSQTF
jgi:hypothetical protein